jgi:hypothetical protein
MKRSSIVLALGALITIGTFVSLPGCGHSQKLVGLEVAPAGFTFPLPNPGATGQFSAIATYIHPPATKDVTTQATWSVDDAVVNISQGLVTTNGSCGSANVRATMPEGTGGASNIVIGYSFVTVNNPADPLCPGGGSQAALGLTVTGPGTVTSSTGGISCPSQCVANFSVGTSVGLTATPAVGRSFVSWGGCTTPAGSSCTVTVPAGGASVTATFQ